MRTRTQRRAHWCDLTVPLLRTRCAQVRGHCAAACLAMAPVRHHRAGTHGAIQTQSGLTLRLFSPTLHGAKFQASIAAAAAGRVQAGFSLRLCSANVCVFPIATRNKYAPVQAIVALITTAIALKAIASQTAHVRTQQASKRASKRACSSHESINHSSCIGVSDRGTISHHPQRISRRAPPLPPPPRLCSFVRILMPSCQMPTIRWFRYGSSCL